MGLTHFPHGLSSFGIPQFGSALDLLTVRGAENEEIFFASKGGSDGNTGKSPDAAKLTVQAAVNLCTHDYGSIVFVGEGNFSEQVTISTRGMKLIGMGPYRTSITPPTTPVNDGEGFYPALTISPTRVSPDRTQGVLVYGLRVSGAGAYDGIYIGDGFAGANQASATVVTNCLIDGCNLEGQHGVIIRGGSFIKIIGNIITGWQGVGVLVSSGYTRTAYANVVAENDIIRNKGTAVFLSSLANCNMIRGNYIGDSATALTYGVGGATTINVGAVNHVVSGGADNSVCGNYFATTGTEINLNAGDTCAGNYDNSAGNAAKFVDEP